MRQEDVMNDKYVRIWKDAAMAYLEVLSRHLP
jgi:hypothetical protein